MFSDINYTINRLHNEQISISVKIRIVSWCPTHHYVDLAAFHNTCVVSFHQYLYLGVPSLASYLDNIGPMTARTRTRPANHRRPAKLHVISAPLATCTVFCLSGAPVMKSVGLLLARYKRRKSLMTARS